MLDHVRDADAVISGMDIIAADVIEAAGRLKVIAKHGVGTDTIDLAAARACGIPVVCAPGSNSRAVAERGDAVQRVDRRLRGCAPDRFTRPPYPSDSRRAARKPP
ncbi:hypothetical protein ACFVYE_25080 [Streptomyces sp. NPDC058239]|uniref:hypothetical protein n=1 Tax=Streptomyces sp. NPDC058239 TaxID=3346395 RepID=UPI0036EF4ACA